MYQNTEADERPAEPDDGFPEESGPLPPPPGSNPQNPNLYQDLLAMCRGDQGMAERLIEFERRKAPTADRNELIQSAMERWIRDNR